MEKNTNFVYYARQIKPKRRQVQKLSCSELHQHKRCIHFHLSHRKEMDNDTFRHCEKIARELIHELDQWDWTSDQQTQEQSVPIALAHNVPGTFSETIDGATKKPIPIEIKDATNANQENFENQKSEVTNQKSAGNRPFSCSFCFRSFRQVHHRKVHLRIHTNERPYACLYCTATFRQKGGLLHHMRMHSNERPFRCSYCPAAFHTKQRQLRHQNTHTDSRPFRCGQCSATFRQKPALDAHLLIHSGAKPHSCTMCSATFRQKSSLSYHLRTHTGEKPYPCPRCSRAFRNSSNRLAHLRTHSQ